MGVVLECRWFPERDPGPHCCSAGRLQQGCAWAWALARDLRGQPRRLSRVTSLFPRLPAVREVLLRPCWLGAASGPAGVGQVGHGPSAPHLGLLMAEKLCLCLLCRPSREGGLGTETFIKRGLSCYGKRPQSLPDYTQEVSEPQCAHPARLAPASCRIAAVVGVGGPLAAHSAAAYGDCTRRCFFNLGQLPYT